MLYDKVFVYQNVRRIDKANVINTINIAKGFLQNNLIVYFFVSKKEYCLFYKSNIPNVIFIVKKKYDFILKFLNEFKINIVYIRDRPFSEYLTKSDYNGYIVSEDHDIDPPKYINKIKNSNKFILATISPLIAKKYNVKNNVVFPCAIDFDYFSNKNNFNSDIFDKKKINVTLCCSTINKIQGIDLVLELAKKHEHINFNIIGNCENNIITYKQNSSKNVIFWGHIEYFKIPNYLYSSDIFILPKSKNENNIFNTTSPIKLFEYLSTKKPVICSNINGIKNWVDENEVLFFEADNIENFYSKFEYLINNINSEEIQKKIDNGFIKAQKFSTKNKCSAFIDKIKSLDNT